jgi:hypothetical protein
MPALRPGGRFPVQGLPCRAPPARGLAALHAGDLRELGGHGQEIIPLPLADGRVTFVPVLGEAR